MSLGDITLSALSYISSYKSNRGIKESTHFEKSRGPVPGVVVYIAHITFVGFGRLSWDLKWSSSQRHVKLNSNLILNIICALYNNYCHCHIS